MNNDKLTLEDAKRMIQNCFFLLHRDCEVCKYNTTCEAYVTKVKKMKEQENERNRQTIKTS